MEYAQLIDRLHDCPTRLVYAFAGAGSQALCWLHARPGSSRTVLEAIDLYASSSMADFLGTTPAAFASGETAGAMALTALVRARELAPEHDKLAGLALTATIATDRSKRGDHRIAVALATADGTWVWELLLDKGALDREQEEWRASELLLAALAQKLDLPGAPEASGGSAASLGAMALALHGGKVRTIGLPGGCGDPPTPGALLPGSFDPLHEGHLELARVAAARLDCPVQFELSVVHPNKGVLALSTIEQRVAQFDNRPLLLSASPLYLDKARAYPGAVIVVGVDTARRILDPRYYDDLGLALTTIRELGCRFLVAGRLSGERFSPAEELEIPAGFERLFEPIPEAEFRVDLSSTSLRNG